MKLIELFVHTPGRDEAELIAVEGDVEIDVVLRRVCGDRHEGFELFHEGHDHPLPRKDCLHHHQVGHHHRLHCRPKQDKALVEVSINGKKVETHRGENTVEHLKA